MSFFQFVPAETGWAKDEVLEMIGVAGVCSLATTVRSTLAARREEE